MSRKERRTDQPYQTGLVLTDVKPMTMNQAQAFRQFHHGDHLVLYGVPGSGKTFVALALALKAIHSSKYRKLVIYRSTVPTRDMGFLPGSADMKAAVYEAPYEAICSELYGRDDAWTILKTRKMVEFKPTAFVRGTTENDSIVLIDEAQNCNFGELNSITTRLGLNSRLIVCGDFAQQDYMGKHDSSGLGKYMQILRLIKDMTFIEMQIEDIVRSGFVKEYLLASYTHESTNSKYKGPQKDTLCSISSTLQLAS